MRGGRRTRTTTSPLSTVCRPYARAIVPTSATAKRRRAAATCGGGLRSNVPFRPRMLRLSLKWESEPCTFPESPLKKSRQIARVTRKQNRSRHHVVILKEKELNYNTPFRVWRRSGEFLLRFLIKNHCSSGFYFEETRINNREELHQFLKLQSSTANSTAKSTAKSTALLTAGKREKTLLFY